MKTSKIKKAVFYKLPVVTCPELISIQVIHAHSERKKTSSQFDYFLVSVSPEFASSFSRAFIFNLVICPLVGIIPSSVFGKAGFVDRLDLFMVSQISWTFCFMTFLDLVFSLTDESISSI
ncbi:hypothetical protein STEG23_028000, partial [Scotinomys teguina]